MKKVKKAYAWLKGIANNPIERVDKRRNLLVFRRQCLIRSVVTKYNKNDIAQLACDSTNGSQMMFSPCPK